MLCPTACGFGPHFSYYNLLFSKFTGSGLWITFEQWWSNAKIANLLSILNEDNLVTIILLIKVNLQFCNRDEGKNRDAFRYGFAFIDEI
jgi:hypothetical protein